MASDDRNGGTKSIPSRRVRRFYYDVFSRCYDRFIRLHSRGDAGETRRFLVASARLSDRSHPVLLDVCCGTGDVVLAAAEAIAGVSAVGCDFSIGMLGQARRKDRQRSAAWVAGDAGRLPFASGCFDAVTCSHAFYELKGDARSHALREMARVVTPDGVVLVLEHETPKHPIARSLFRLRMAVVGALGTADVLGEHLRPFRAVFHDVTLSRSPSGKSRLVACRRPLR